MGNRAIQLALVGIVGAFLAWWLTRGEANAPTSEEPVIVPDPTPQTGRVEPEPPPRKVTFRLPKVASATPQLVREQAPPAQTTFHVPKDWLLRGSASRNYELRSDRGQVFTGNFSSILFSQEKDISPNLSGSGVQAVLAGPYVGTRVELSGVLRAEGATPGAGSLWLYVTDPARVVVAYQIVQMSPTVEPANWTRYRVVMDVPWHAEVIAFGFTLKGKGKLWADDMRFTPVDTNVPLTSPQNNHQLGVIAQAVSLEGALANPTNMDFEDVQATRERQPGPPPDEIKGTRY
jgi:hypothetical protein